MPRRIIKRYLPDHDKIRNHKHLKLLRPLLQDPNLLHLNRRSVSGGFAVGLFMAWVPVPFQMFLAAFAAIIIRVNLPISVALVWVTNPITMPPMFYFAYKIGAWTLGLPPRHVHFELTWGWLSESLGAIWEPFLLGCLITGVVSSLLGYLIVNRMWRAHVIQSWKARKEKRRDKLVQKT